MAIENGVRDTARESVVPEPAIAHERNRALAALDLQAGSAGSPEAATYYAVAAAKKWEYALLYLGLAAFLAMMAFDTHEELGTWRSASRG